MTIKPHNEDPVKQNQQTPPSTRADVTQWRCLNCGQHIFVIIDADPPDVCEYCNDMTTWEHIPKSS